MVFRKQKAKEVDAAEQANQRELNTIRHLLSDVISDVERIAESERVEIRKMVDELLKETVEEVITAAQKSELVKMDPSGVKKESSGSISPKPVVPDVSMKCEEMKMDVEAGGDTADAEKGLNLSSIHDSGFDEVDAKQQSSVDTKQKTDDPNISGVECIDLSSDEKEDMQLSKDELDDEMLRIAASAAKTHPEQSKLADFSPQKNEMECAALGFATASNLPPNVPLEGLEYYSERTFEPYPHEQVPDDNYYYTLDDLRGLPSRTTKVKSVSF